MAEPGGDESVPPVTVAESKESTAGDATISTVGDTTENTLETTEEGTERTESNVEQTGGADQGEASVDDKSKKEDEKTEELNETDKKEEVKLEDPTKGDQKADEKQEEGAQESNEKEGDGAEVPGGDEKGDDKENVSAEEKPEGETVASAVENTVEEGEGEGAKDEDGGGKESGEQAGEGERLDEVGVGGEEDNRDRGTEGVEDTDGPTEAPVPEDGDSGEGKQTETTEGEITEQQVEGQVPTIQLSGKSATDSVAILTAIAEEEEEEVSQEELRQELVEQMISSLEEKKELEGQRDTLEHAIAEHLANKKAEKDQDLPRPAPDIRKYSIILSKITELRSSMEKAQEKQARKEEKLVAKMNSDLEQARRAREYLIACRKDRFIGLLNSRTGKRLTVADLDHYHTLEDEKEEEIKKIRLNNIKLMAKMSKLNESLRQKEQLAQGLHMIDFEQLKINNIDLNEKIEERNDDILKLRKKVTSTVQVLTHVKEKLQFLQQEKAERKAVLSEIEIQLAMKRDELTHLKQARDALRADNQRLKQKGGLVGHKTLLRDFEERLDESEEMRQRLEQLQRRHSELAVMCDGIKRKIETAKMLEAEAIANR